MPPYCSPVTRAQIIDLIDQGHSTYDVAQRVLRHPTTVARIYARYHQNHNFYHTKCKPGRPRKLSPSDIQYVLNLLARRKARNIAELQRAYFPNTSAESIRRALRGLGLHGHVHRKVTYISNKHRQHCRAWARYAIHFSRGFWSRVIFSDESPFKVFKANSRDWCWWDSGDPFDTRYIMEKVAHGGGQVMVWGCIMSSGVG
jgi:transposase